MAIRTAYRVLLAAVGTGFAGSGWCSTPLIEAVRSQDSAVRQLIREGADVNERTNDGSTALIWASYLSDTESAAALIDAGADVAATNEFGASAMSEAAAIGHAEIIGLLLAAGADPNSANAEGETALMAVARTGQLEAARVLLAGGADVDAREEWGGQTALMWAAAQLQPQMIALLIEHGADVDARGAVRDWQRRITAEGRPKDMNKGGFTPLLYAVRGGCLVCVQHLVAAGADVDSPDPDGVTPLILAIDNFEFEVADYLVDAGADIDRWDLYGRTPLYAAIDINTVPAPDRPGIPSFAGRALTARLLDLGANPNSQLKQRRPPFRHAIFERGADNSLSTGATPLLRAAHASDNESVRLLLDHGALVDLPNAAGLTPLMAAAGLGLSPRSNRGRYKTETMGIESVGMLLAAGADIGARIDDKRRLEQESYRTVGGAVRQNSTHMPTNGQTALHGAARHGWHEMIRFLVANGARIDVADAQGLTPYDMAMGHYEQEPLDPPHEPRPDTAALIEELCRHQDGCRIEEIASLAAQ